MPYSKTTNNYYKNSFGLICLKIICKSCTLFDLFTTLQINETKQILVQVTLGAHREELTGLTGDNYDVMIAYV